MNADRMEQLFRALGWLMMAGIVFGAAVVPPVHSPAWIRYAPLAAGACLLWEWLLGHERLNLSRIAIGFLLAFLLLNGSHDVWFSGLAVSVSAILFVAFSLCFLAVARRGGMGLTVPPHGLCWGLGLLIPLVVAEQVAEFYTDSTGFVPVMVGQFILFLAATAVFASFLAGRRTCAFALLLVAVRLALSGMV